MAAGGRSESCYVFFGGTGEGGDFKPRLGKVELMSRQNFLFNLPKYVFRGRGGNKKSIMKPHQRLCRVSGDEGLYGIFYDHRLKVLEQPKGTVREMGTILWSEAR